MKTFLVPKDELLKKLNTNREEHHKVWEEVIVNYRKAVIKELDSMLDDALAGKKIRTFISLTTPEDHTADYDRIIGLLRMCTDTEVELSQQEYAQYVQDDWGWKNAWVSSNAGYSTMLSKD